MKKISVLIFLLLTAFSFQCSDHSNEPARYEMNPELQKELDAMSKRLNIVWVNFYRNNFSKTMKLDPVRAASIFDDLRASMDSQHQAAFDLVMKDEKIQKFLEWCNAQAMAVKTGNGRVEDVWDFGTIVSPEVQTRISQLHDNINNTLGTMDGMDRSAVYGAVFGNISDWRSDAYASTTLTQDEKTSIGSAAAIVWDQVAPIVDTYYSADGGPINGTRMQSWRNIWQKVGSVVAFTVAAALVAATAGTILVALGASAALLETATLAVGSTAFAIVSVSAAIGGAAGLVYGTVMAAENMCFTNGAGSTPLGFVSCDV